MFLINDDVLITADTHFGHAKIIEYCNRPYKSAHCMDKDLIEKWNSVVRPDGYIIHLGDFSFVSNKYIDKLNGKKILVRGNHDNKIYNSLFDGVVEFLPVKIGEFNCLLRHRPITRDIIYKKGHEPDFSLLDRYDFLIVGHVHEKWKINGNNINVGVDQWDYRPISIGELVKFLRFLKT